MTSVNVPSRLLRKAHRERRSRSRHTGPASRRRRSPTRPPSSHAPARGDAGPVRHVGERAVAVVVEEIIPLALRMGRRVEHIGLDEDIEPAVAIVVAEVGHDAAVRHVEPVRVRLLLERAVALVDVEQVRRIEPADVDVQQPVIVHVDECRALLPDLGGRAVVADPGLFRDVLELPIAEIVKEPAAPGLAHDKDVRKAVVVIVADGHPGADRAEIELTRKPAPDRRVVVVIFGAQAAFLGGMIVKRVLPRGPDRGASGCSSMLPGDAGAGSAMARLPTVQIASAAALRPATPGANPDAAPGRSRERFRVPCMRFREPGAPGRPGSLRPGRPSGCRTP
jgi:hypothetical protein